MERVCALNFLTGLLKAASRKACRLFLCHFARAGKFLPFDKKLQISRCTKLENLISCCWRETGCSPAQLFSFLTPGKARRAGTAGFFRYTEKRRAVPQWGDKNFEKVFGALRGHSTEEKRRNARKRLFIRHKLSNIHRRRKMIRRFFEKRRLKLYREVCYNTLRISKRKSGASYDALTRCRKTVLFAGPSEDKDTE